MTHPWQSDVLGEPFEVERIPMADDAEGPVVAALVRRRSSSDTPPRAVLHVHGFNDYFFHTDYARWWDERGYAFHALDLRKYGRALLDHQTPHFVTSLEEHFEELDAAWDRITRREGCAEVVLSAHSTGGLIVPLWVRSRSPAGVRAMVLNSPWFDLHGAPLLRSLPARAVLDQVGARQPHRAIPRSTNDLYARSLHVNHGGEWNYDLDWKSPTSRQVFAGWLRAVRRGHSQLHKGLELDVPTLVLSSLRTSNPTRIEPDLFSTDVVLDVHQIRKWASSIGTHVTSIAVPDAMHDIFLSRLPARERAYRELHRWLACYAEEPQ